MQQAADAVREGRTFTEAEASVRGTYPKVELHTAGVGFTETAKEVDAGHRLYGNVEGDLLYAYDMAAMGQEIQPHLWARLQRQ